MYAIFTHATNLLVTISVMPFLYGSVDTQRKWKYIMNWRQEKGIENLFNQFFFSWLKIGSLTKRSDLIKENPYSISEVLKVFNVEVDSEVSKECQQFRSEFVYQLNLTLSLIIID